MFQDLNKSRLIYFLNVGKLFLWSKLPNLTAGEINVIELIIIFF